MKYGQHGGSETGSASAAIPRFRWSMRGRGSDRIDRLVLPHLRMTASSLFPDYLLFSGEPIVIDLRRVSIW